MSATMEKLFNLPDLGEGLTESEILSWRVAVGDTVELNQIIAEVETAKAVVELPSPFSGVVTKVFEPVGAVVNVGNPIISFEVPAPAGAPTDRQPTLVGYGAAVESTGRPARRGRTSAPEPEAERQRKRLPQPQRKRSPKSTNPLSSPASRGSGTCVPGPRCASWPATCTWTCAACIPAAPAD